jgi:hypothetical protein
MPGCPACAGQHHVPAPAHAGNRLNNANDTGCNMPSQKNCAQALDIRSFSFNEALTPVYAGARRRRCPRRSSSASIQRCAETLHFRDSFVTLT